MILNIFCEVTSRYGRTPAAWMITSNKMKGVLLTTLMIVALLASTQGQYNIHSKRFYSFFGCKGNATDVETHVSGACFAVNASASVGGYRVWTCGNPCPDGICLGETVYNDCKACT